MNINQNALELDALTINLRRRRWQWLVLLLGILAAGLLLKVILAVYDICAAINYLWADVHYS